MDFALLHTAKKCPAIFDQALTEIGADVRLGYHVEVSPLFGADVVQADVSSLARNFSDAYALICLCSSSDPLADEEAKPVCNANEACVESVVLSRASMRVAETGLAGTGFPFYDSPFLVDQQGLDIDRANSTKTEGTI